jgi:hypothetical protein
MTQMEWPSSSPSSFVAVPYLDYTATLRNADQTYRELLIQETIFRKQPGGLSGVLGPGNVFREALARAQVRGVEL